VENMDIEKLAKELEDEQKKYDLELRVVLTSTSK
jgi:hypothetical protein